MRYVEMTVEEAKKRCKKNAKVLVAVQDLEDDNVDVIFVPKRRCEYEKLFEDVETVAGICGDFINQSPLYNLCQPLH